MSDYDDDCDDEYEDGYDCAPDAEDDPEREFVLACGVDGCVMQGYHFRYECVTAEQMADYHREGELEELRALPTDVLVQRVRDLGEEIGVALAELDARGATP